MMKCVFVAVLCLLALSFLEQAEAQRRYATCKCQGCRPQTFSCDYNTFGGCNCARCSCIRSSKPPTHTCCSNCKTMWGTKRKCWKCPVSRGCNYKSCSCY